MRYHQTIQTHAARIWNESQARLLEHNRTRQIQLDAVKAALIPAPVAVGEPPKPSLIKRLLGHAK